MAQYIFGGFSPVTLRGSGKILLKSSGTLVEDYAADSPVSSVGPVLCSFKSTPIAFWDVPTLNNMVFSRRLWEDLLDNEYFKKSLEEGSHFGCSAHQDTDQIDYKDIACRVTRFWLGENNLVLGDLDLLNVPNGVIVYTLAKVSRVCTSSRGFGELRDMGNGLKDVVPEQYTHVCWDMVTFPAVPNASMSLITGENSLPTKELDSLSEHLRSLVRQAYEANPGNGPLRELFSAVGGLGKRSFRVSMADLRSALVAHNVRVSSLYSGKHRATVSRRRVFSSPDNESWLSYDVGLEAKLEVFCKALGLQLTAALGVRASASLGKEFLRGNQNVLYWVDVTFTGATLRVLRLVGVRNNLDYQISLFGVKWSSLVRAEFFNNALVARIVGQIMEGVR
jgi:hypothetical protein